MGHGLGDAGRGVLYKQTQFPAGTRPEGRGDRGYDCAKQTQLVFRQRLALGLRRPDQRDDAHEIDRDMITATVRNGISVLSQPSRNGNGAAR